MQDRLFAREIGDLSGRDFSKIVTTELLRGFGYAPQHRFDGGGTSTAAGPSTDDYQITAGVQAHKGGVNSIAIEKFNGRLLVSGGADGSLKLWDLESCGNPNNVFTYRPTASIARCREAQRREGHVSGITHLDFHPFNKDTFLSGSFDHTLKQWSAETASVTENFELKAKIYCHATSPISTSVLVACATQHPNLRLVDLKSGSTAGTLPSNGGPVLAVSWSPRHERVLCCGSADGRVRVYDVRRPSGPLGLLDMEDSLGVIHRFKHATASGMAWPRIPTFRAAARAHNDAVNGLTWTDDGNFIVSAGMDRRIRVWNAATGANTLAGYGSSIQNPHAAALSMFASPSGLTVGIRQLLFYPNAHEILVLDLHEGHVVTRLRIPGSVGGSSLGVQGPARRITSIAWRGLGGNGRPLGIAMGGGNAAGGIYAGHTDGQIRAFVPQLQGEDEADEDPVTRDGGDDKKRKRKVLDDAFRSLMGKQITFT